jgi:hypothetical protein
MRTYNMNVLLCVTKKLNSELKKDENYTCDPSKHEVEGSPSALGHGPYGERHADCRYETLMCNIPKI